MAYLVDISVRAERDLIFLYEQINAAESAAARKWFQALKKSILSLQDHPHRCPRAPENRQLRHLLHGKTPHVYRVIYRVLEKRKVVEVLHIRHGARRSFRTSDLR